MNYAETNNQDIQTGESKIYERHFVCNRGVQKPFSNHWEDNYASQLMVHSGGHLDITVLIAISEVHVSNVAYYENFRSKLKFMERIGHPIVGFSVC